MFINRHNQIKQLLQAVTLLLVVLAGTLSHGANNKRWRILDVKSKIFSAAPTIKIKDIISNPKLLTDTEQNLTVMDTPVDRSVTISINELAYRLQKYQELFDAKLRGPRNIVIRKLQNKEYLYKAKEAVTAYIKKTDPWKDWEVDILFSNDDELRITKVGEFDSVNVIPYDNKSMIGTLGFRLTFFNKNKTALEKIIINPVILKKIDVVVFNTTSNSGHIIKQSDLKTVPLWVGDQKKSYVTKLSRCLGKELARKMTYGDIVRETDLLNPMCVKRGDIIWVQCKSGALNVKVVAIALQPGRQGDFIKVRNRSSQKEFMVQLTGPKKAQYRLKG